MRLNKNKIANTFALATGVLWILCSALVWLLPAFSWQATIWWMHGMDLSVLGGWSLTFGNFLSGGITIVASAWVIGWVLGWSWDMVGGKR